MSGDESVVLDKTKIPSGCPRGGPLAIPLPGGAVAGRQANEKRGAKGEVIVRSEMRASICLRSSGCGTEQQRTPISTWQSSPTRRARHSELS